MSSAFDVTSFYIALLHLNAPLHFLSRRELGSAGKSVEEDSSLHL